MKDETVASAASPALVEYRSQSQRRKRNCKQRSSSLYFRVSINEQNESQAGWRRTRSAKGSSQRARGYPEGEGSVEGSHADRAQGLYQLDRLGQATGDT